MVSHHRSLAALLALHASRSNSPIMTAAQVDPSEHQAFADELTALIYENANECSSALGVSMAFSLIYPGCVGDAVDEVRETLRYPGGSNMMLVWEETTNSMLESAGGQCVGGVSSWDGSCYSEAPVLKIANSVWFHDGETLNEDYEDVVGDYAMQTNFTAAESPIIVNEWVENSTNGMIDSIVDPSKPLFPSDVLIAINSIYLKARWAEQFSEYFTNLDSFYSSALKTTEVSKAHFMNTVGYFGYSHEALPGYQVIDLAFEQSSMSMIFVLPMNDGAKAVESTDLIPTLDDLVSTRVALSMPKFKFESKYEDGLKDALFQLGIKLPFTEGSGALCGLFENDENCESLIITKVIQKTVIDVNEKGVEAAAVTAIGVSLTSAGPPPPVPILMVLDHPFQFFIYDKSEDLMLFEGRLGAPEVPEAEPTMDLLDAVHSDPEFWSTVFYVDPIDPPALDATTTAATTTEQAATIASSTVKASVSSMSQPTEASSLSSTSKATTVPQIDLTTSTTVATTPAKTPVNPTGDATTTSSTVTSTSTVSTTTSLLEPEAITNSSSDSTPNKRFAAMCTSIFLAFASAYVL